MTSTARSTPNIAFIKYWGNQLGHDDIRLCAADSLSMTLDGPHVDVTVSHAPELSVTSVTMGQPKEINEKNLQRFQKHIDLTKEYLSMLGAPDAIPNQLSISIDSQIPPSIGLASSAAVFSGVAKAISGLIADQVTLTEEQVSVIARMGSGSATRSIYGGYGAIKVNDSAAIDSAIGWQVADEDHWLLHDIIIVPSQEEKKVGSTEGHAGAHTSPHMQQRIVDIQTRRQPECINAILNKDFEKLTAVVEEDCMDMHEQIMQQQSTPLQYLSDETYRIIGEIKERRSAEHIPVLFTMDAGPTVHLFCPDEAVDWVRAYAHEQPGTVFEARTGKGAIIL